MRVLLTGASGLLGAELLACLQSRGHDIRAWSGSATGSVGGIGLRPVELSDPGALEQALDDEDPAAILHAAARASAARVHEDPVHARAINTIATQQIASWCHQRGRRLLFVSTDLVFDGRRPWNREQDLPKPILEYGRTKFAAEGSVLSSSGGLVARVSLLFGSTRCSRSSFFATELAALRRGESRAYFEDEFRTPLSYRTAATILVHLLESPFRGLIHVGGTERLSRLELMRRAAAVFGFDSALVRANRQRDVPSPEPRPVDVSLDTSRLAAWLPSLDRPTVESALEDDLRRNPGLATGV